MRTTTVPTSASVIRRGAPGPRLLTEALAVAEGMGFRVLRGARDDVEQDRPLHAVVEALGGGDSPPTVRTLELAELLRAGAVAAGRPAAVMGVVDGSWVVVEAGYWSTGRRSWTGGL